MNVKKHFGFLASRKVRVGLATVAVSWAAQYGLQVSEEVMLTILGVGVSLILGIAHEDNGAKAAGGAPTLGGEQKVTGTGQ